MTEAALIQGAFPRDTAKHLERELGCTRRQAQRIAETGRVPSRLWALAERVIERALEANEERIRQAREDLKAIRCERMACRAETRLVADGRSDVAADSECDAARQLPLIEDAA